MLFLRQGTETEPELDLFYEEGQPHYEFTNLSPHSVNGSGTLRGAPFQAFKVFFISMEGRVRRLCVAVVRRLSPSNYRACSDKAMVAFDETHKFYGSVRQDWTHVRKEKVCIRG